MKCQVGGYCACGSSIVVTGTVKGCAAAIQEWRVDHNKPECRPVTRKEQHRLKAQKKHAEKIARKKAEQERLNGIVTQSKLPLFEWSSANPNNSR